MSTFQLGGLVDIDDPTVDGVFPLAPDFDVTRELDYPYVIHKISLKREQRILTRQAGRDIVAQTRDG